MPTALLLEPNPPLNRFKYIAKQYGEKHPDVVLDTFFSLADTVGIENPAREFDAIRRWDRVRVAMQSPFSKIQSESSRNRQHREILQQLLKELEDEPRMKQGRESDALWPWLARELVRSKKAGATMTDRGPAWMAWSAEVDGKGPAIAQWWSLGRMRVLRPGDTGLTEGAVVHKSVYDAANDVVRQRKRELWEQGRRAESEQLKTAAGEKVGIDLMKFTIPEMLEILEDFELAGRAVPQGEVVYEFDDDWTIQRLTTPEQLKAEGEVMQHCVGNYCDAVSHGDSIIYSLRDPGGKPHATMETHRTLKRFVQVQGKQNQAPIEAYRERVDEFAEATGINPSSELTRREYDQAYEYGVERGEDAWRERMREVSFAISRASDQYEGETIYYYEVLSNTKIEGDAEDWGDTDLGSDLEDAALEGANEAWSEGQQALMAELDDLINDVAQAAQEELDEGAEPDEIDIDYAAQMALESSDLPWGHADLRYVAEEAAGRTG